MDCFCNIFTNVNFKVFLSEFTASALTVYLGCMVIAPADDQVLSIALGVGYVRLLILHIFGSISGGHCNPSISLMAYAMHYLNCERALLYISGQLTGAISGYYLLQQTLPDVANMVDCKCMSQATEMTNVQAGALELILTTGLLIGHMTMWDLRTQRFIDSFALQNAAMATAVTLAGYKYTGASFNLAKTLATCIYHADFSQFLYFGGAHIAAVPIAQAVWKFGLENAICNWNQPGPCPGPIIPKNPCPCDQPMQPEANKVAAPPRRQRNRTAEPDAPRNLGNRYRQAEPPARNLRAKNPQRNRSRSTSQTRRWHARNN